MTAHHETTLKGTQLSSLNSRIKKIHTSFMLGITKSSIFFVNEKVSKSNQIFELQNTHQNIITINVRRC